MVAQLVGTQAEIESLSIGRKDGGLGPHPTVVEPARGIWRCGFGGASTNRPINRAMFDCPSRRDIATQEEAVGRNYCECPSVQIWKAGGGMVLVSFFVCLGIDFAWRWTKTVSHVKYHRRWLRGFRVGIYTNEEDLSCFMAKRRIRHPLPQNAPSWLKRSLVARPYSAEMRFAECRRLQCSMSNFELRSL